MVIEFEKLDNFPNPPHEFSVWKLTLNTTNLNSLAEEYSDLRVGPLPSRLLNFEGIDIVDISEVQTLLASRTIPERQQGNFDIIRSDMGETLGYVLLESNYNTLIGYKGVRERELVDRPGRGFDIIGVEDGQKLKLLFGEVKVSDEDRETPQVVDSSSDSISKTLKKHMQNHEETVKKTWDVARKTRDPVEQQRLLEAALYFDYKKWDKLEVVCCAVLVRSSRKYQEENFGELKQRPELVTPGNVRFLIVCFDCELYELVNQFYHSLQELRG